MAETASTPGPAPALGASMETNASVNMLSLMPGLCGKNSLHFRGKHIMDFLTEYECTAAQANLTDVKKCQE